MILKQLYLKPLILLLVGGIFIACGGSSSTTTTTDSTTTTSNKLPSEISLINTDDGSGSTSSKTLNSKTSSAFNEKFSDANTDYTNTVTNIYNRDVELEAIEFTNMLLGIFENSAFASFINAGKYIAMIEEDNDDQNGGGDSSQNTQELDKFIFDVTQENNDSNISITLWIPSEKIYANVQMESGVTDDLPIGSFKLNWKQDQAIRGNPRGAVEVGATGGKPYIKSVNLDDSHTGGEIASLVEFADSNLTNIQGVENSFDYQKNQIVIKRVAINDTHVAFLKADGNTTYFDKNITKDFVFRYQLFDDENGSLLKLNSGKGGIITDSNGSTGFAYVGYWGLWHEDGISPKSGDVFKDERQDIEYTLFTVGGKLEKFAKTSIEMSKMDGIEISTWDHNNNQEIIISWDKNSTSFKTIGTRDNNWNITYLNTPTSYTVSQRWDGGWCQALETHIQYGELYFDNNNNAITPTNSSTLNYHTRSTVMPGDINSTLTLYTKDWTLDAYDTTTLNNADNSQQSYFSNFGSRTEKTFTFDPNTMMLKDSNGTDVSFIVDDNVSQQSIRHGYRISLTQEQNNSDHIRGSDTFYEWSTGKEWNNLAGLKDSNSDFIKFDKPISIKYTHTTANDRNGDSTNDGKTYTLRYEGELQVPWSFDKEKDQWKPAISIKDAVSVTIDNVLYVIKATDIERSTKKLASAPANAPVVDTSLVLPDNSLFEETRLSFFSDGMPDDTNLSVLVEKGVILE